MWQTASQNLADAVVGCRATTSFNFTARALSNGHASASAALISRWRSRKARSSLPDTTVRLVAAKTPPPPPSTAPPPPTAPEQDCDPSYPDVCLDPAVEDYDCAGGTGNGPEYVEGPIRVLPPDPFDLDREGDGVGCENG